MPTLDSRRRHLNALSRWAARACLLLIPLSIFSLMAVWIWMPEVVTADFRTAGASPMTTEQWLLAVLLSMIPLAISIYGLLHLSWLFDLFARGELFSALAARHLYIFAGALLARTLINPVVHSAIGVIASWNNPPGQRMLAIEISDSGIAWLLIAALLFALSRVMAVAEEIAEDQKMIV